jgi:hypothetical protein
LIEDILHQRRIRAGARRVAQGLRQAQLDVVFDIEVIRVGFGIHWGLHGARLLIHCMRIVRAMAQRQVGGVIFGSKPGLDKNQ